MKSKEQYAEHIAHLAAEFLSRESNRTSLITVTRADVTDKMTVANIYCSVFPESDEANALIFLKRMAGECKHYLMHEHRMVRVPHINFVIDYGEKNRVRLDEVSKVTPKEGEVMVTAPRIAEPQKKKVVKKTGKKRVAPKKSSTKKAISAKKALQKKRK
jgi:ribosome-binding factor A